MRSTTFDFNSLPRSSPLKATIQSWHKLLSAGSRAPFGQPSLVQRLRKHHVVETKSLTPHLLLLRYHGTKLSKVQVVDAETTNDAFPAVSAFPQLTLGLFLFACPKQESTARTYEKPTQPATIRCLHKHKWLGALGCTASGWLH